MSIQIWSSMPFEPVGARHGDVWGTPEGNWFIATQVANKCHVKHRCGCVALPMSHIEWRQVSAEHVNAHISASFDE